MILIIRVPSFEAQQFPVTNYEFLKFVQAGGYENKEYWSKEGTQNHILVYW